MLTTETIKHLGNLKFGQPHDFKYILKNEYPEAITITEIVRGCNSCTKATISKQIIAPRETSELSVTYIPGTTGFSKKTINIQYEIGHEKKKDHIVVEFKANIS